MIPFMVFLGSFLGFAIGSVGYQVLLERRRERERAAAGGKSEERRFLARLRRMARPTLLLTAPLSPGFSKVGGLPELPDGVAWPAGDQEPRAFVAQIDLAEAHAQNAFDWLPVEGRLYFFFDDDHNGAPDVVQVIFSSEPAGAAREPSGPISKRWRFKEQCVGFARFNSVPSLDWLDLGIGAFESSEEGPTFADCDLGDGVQHRMGGYPEEIQGGAMAIDCEFMRRGQTRNYGEEVPEAILRASKAWRLLLQVDSDSAIGMNWWDGGRLYVFVREKDAARGDFSKTVTITQTH